MNLEKAQRNAPLSDADRAADRQGRRLAGEIIDAAERKAQPPVAGTDE